MSSTSSSTSSFIKKVLVEPSPADESTTPKTKLRVCVTEGAIGSLSPVRIHTENDYRLIF
jgi:hypothetical protein